VPANNVMPAPAAAEVDSAALRRPIKLRLKTLICYTADWSTATYTKRLFINLWNLGQPGFLLSDFIIFRRRRHIAFMLDELYVSQRNGRSFD
jgi:hypothetical protein